MEVSIFQQLHDDLLARVPYPEHIRVLMEDAEPWRAFCELPLELRMQFHYTDHRDEWYDAGFEQTTREDGKDDKCVYHFDGRHEDLVQHYGLGEVISNEPKLQAFFDWASRIHEALVAWVVDLAQGMELDVPGALKEFQAGAQSFTIRFIQYEPRNDIEVGDLLGAAHYDGSFTLHLFESQPGLQYLDWGEDWKTIEIPRGSTVVFSGYKFHQLTRGRVEKTWHRIIKEADSTDPRVSIVLFCELPRMTGYNKRHMRPRDETPGYRNPPPIAYA